MQKDELSILNFFSDFTDLGEPVEIIEKTNHKKSTPIYDHYHPYSTQHKNDQKQEITPIASHYQKQLNKYEYNSRHTFFGGQKRNSINLFHNTKDDQVIYLKDSCSENKTPDEMFNHLNSMDKDEMTTLTFSENPPKIVDGDYIYRFRILPDSKHEYHKNRLWLDKKTGPLAFTKEEIMRLEVWNDKNKEWVSLNEKKLDSDVSLTEQSKEVELTEYSDLVTISL